MTNLINKISNQQMVKDFGITEAFFLAGEFHITSKWDLNLETVANIEKELEAYK